MDKLAAVMAVSMTGDDQVEKDLQNSKKRFSASQNCKKRERESYNDVEDVK